MSAPRRKLAIGVGLALLVGCGSPPETPDGLRLEMRPTTVAGGAEFDVRAVAPDDEELTTGMASRLDAKRNGTWVPIFHLFFALPGGKPIARPYSPEGPAVRDIGYSANRWNRLRLPSGLAPGRYRLVKDVLLLPGPSSVSLSVVFTLVR